MRAISVVDEVLELLRNGEWHDIEETAEKLKVDAVVVHEIMAFLAQYELVQLDKDHRKVRLTPHTIRLMKV